MCYPKNKPLEEMNNTQKFTGKAKAYQKGRPSYAPALLRDLAQEYHFYHKTIADIGAGTGIFTKQLLDLDNTVYAVEPNEDMRKAAENDLSTYSQFYSIAGSAEQTTLKEHSMDAVTTAQAFHWFDPTAFETECRRILKPNGWVALIWNEYLESDVLFAETAVLEKFCPAFKVQRNNTPVKEKIHLLLPVCEERSYPNEYSLTKEQYLANCLSKSWTLTPQDNEFQNYMEALEDVFEKFASKNKIPRPMQTILYIGKL